MVYLSRSSSSYRKKRFEFEMMRVLHGGSPDGPTVAEEVSVAMSDK